MENILELKGLVMPSNYVSIDDEEMEYVDGCWGFRAIFTCVCGVISGLSFTAAGIVGLCTDSEEGQTAIDILNVVGGVTGVAAAIAALGPKGAALFK